MLKLKQLLSNFIGYMHFYPPWDGKICFWSNYHYIVKERAPIRYFIMYVMARYIKNIGILYEKINDKIRYTYVAKHQYHIVRTGLKIGYHEIDDRMLYASFNLLREYVEIQCANMHKMSEDKCNTYNIRDRAAGLEFLDWEISLSSRKLPKDERCLTQAKQAREIKKLYLWWVDERLPRDSFTYLKFSDQGLLQGERDARFNRLAPDYVAYRKHLLDFVSDSDKWIALEDANLIRLMKIRRGLWT
jgi:hypothetical protein